MLDGNLCVLSVCLGEVRPALSDLAGANRDPSFILLVSIDIVVGGDNDPDAWRGEDYFHTSSFELMTIVVPR